MKTAIAIMPALLLAALAGCGATGEADDQAIGGNAVENTTLTRFALTSDAFADGQPIPARFSCDGGDRSPALSWGEPPDGTKSFALIVDDPDAPGGPFRHLGAFDIPASVRSLAAGQDIGPEVTNDFGKTGYGGPCPPKGHGPHHYHFKLYALDVDHLGIEPHAKIAELEAAANQHAIGRAELIRTFERKWP